MGLEFGMTNKEIEAIQQDIRDLRDSAFHVCSFEYHDLQVCEEDELKTFTPFLKHRGINDGTCTCNNFDLVIDKVDELRHHHNYPQ